MPTNINPIFSGAPQVGFTSTITAQNTAMDGTGTTNLMLTLGTDGGFVGVIYAKPKGTNIPSVARFWGNNGSDPTVAANNYFLDELTLPSTTATTVAANSKLGIVLNQAFPANHRIYVTLGAAVSAGWQFFTEGGTYTKL